MNTVLKTKDEALNRDKSYRAKTEYVIPKSRREIVNTSERCILGFSMENSKFANNKVEAMIKWINSRYKECAIVIGDSIHNYTLQIRKGISEEQARIESNDLAKETIRSTMKLFNNPENKCKFIFYPMSKVQSDSKYEIYRDNLWNVYHSNEKFYNSVTNFARLFLGRKEGTINPKDLTLSTKYLIEELGVFAYLYKKGWPVFVYPGDSLTTFVEITDNYYPEAPEDLKNLTYVALKLKARKNKAIV